MVEYKVFESVFVKRLYVLVDVFAVLLVVDDCFAC